FMGVVAIASAIGAVASAVRAAASALAPRLPTGAMVVLALGAAFAPSAVTCVACFEAVGSILVVAMLVTPAVIARMLADSMRSVVAIAAAAGIAAALLGHLAATALPRALGLAPAGIRDLSTAGSIAVTLGFLLAVTVLVDRTRRAPYPPAA
ncbi:MAG: metal ABC transporter permease, partial [Phycisphaerales bacterium]